MASSTTKDTAPLKLTDCKTTLLSGTSWAAWWNEVAVDPVCRRSEVWRITAWRPWSWACRTRPLPRTRCGSANENLVPNLIRSPLTRDSRDMQERCDVDLLGLVAQRDEVALRELVERHSAWLLLRLRRRTPDQDLAAEASPRRLRRGLEEPALVPRRRRRGPGCGGSRSGAASPARGKRAPAGAGGEPDAVGPVAGCAQRRGRAAGRCRARLGRRRPATPVARAAAGAAGDRDRRALHEGGWPICSASRRARSRAGHGSRSRSCASS